MTPFALLAIFIAITSLVGVLNARVLRWPSATVMLIAGLIAAAGLEVAAEQAPASAAGTLVATIRKVDFTQAVIGYMLAFLLFAGGTQVDLSELRRRRLSVWSLATVGVLASTVVVGLLLALISARLGRPLGFGPALVFGALISPTDPVATLAAVRQGSLSSRLQAVLQGEALFNDGVGIVVFSAAVALAFGGGEPGLGGLGRVLAQAAGGVAIGFVAAHLCVMVQRLVDDTATEISLTLALAMGVYALAEPLHVSGPIAVAVAGIVMGDEASSAMRPESLAHLKGFWSLVDELLNAVVFLLLGLQLLVVGVRLGDAPLWAAAFVLVTLVRFAVVVPWGIFFRFREGERFASVVLAWGGLHGALSLALVLSLPPSPLRAELLSLTFAVVVASTLAQGLTFGPLTAAVAARRRSRRKPPV